MFYLSDLKPCWEGLSIIEETYRDSPILRKCNSGARLFPCGCDS
jgi:hypothetical protein